MAQRTVQRFCMCIVVPERKEERDETRGAFHCLSLGGCGTLRSTTASHREAIFPKVKWCWKVIQNSQVFKHTASYLNWRVYTRAGPHLKQVP